MNADIRDGEMRGLLLMGEFVDRGRLDCGELSGRLRVSSGVE